MDNLYKIETKSSKEYTLKKNSIIIGSLSFINWSINNFELIVNNIKYKLQYNNFWTSNAKLYANDEIYCDIKKKWFGKRIITINNDVNTILEFENTGIISRKFQLNTKTENIYSIQKKINLSKLVYEFNIEFVNSSYINDKNDVLILLHLYFILLDRRRKKKVIS